MNKILEYLEQLELSEIEAKIYLQLLKTGAISVSDLAITMGINRTTTYVYVDQLIDKELVVKIVKGSRTQVAAMQPDKMLPYLVEQKIAHTKKIQEELPAVLKDFHKNFPKVEESEEAEVKYYKGKLGVKKIYEEALKADEVRTYIKLQEHEPIFSDYIKLFEEVFERNEKLIVQEIIYDFLVEAQDTHKLLSKYSRYKYKLMPSNMKVNSEDILIYSGKVAIINYKDKKTLHGVILQSKDYYNNSVEFFDYIWGTLPNIPSTSILS